MKQKFNIVKTQYNIVFKYISYFNHMDTYFVNMEDEVKLTNIFKTSIKCFDKNLNQV